MIKLGEPFIKLSQVDSTNNYALALIKSELAVNGSAIFAHQQTNGKGQMGKVWQTNANENIILSIIADISTIHLQNQFSLVSMAALGCYDFFTKYAIDKTAIKWSNDLYWNDKKAGGILIETITHQQKRYAIIGIGININQTIFDENLPNPVSLKQITGKNFDVVELAKELCTFVNKWYEVLLNDDKELLLKTYNSHLYKKDETVTLKKGNVKFNCTVKSVNEFGELLVDSGFEQAFKFGEVEWVKNN